jgi:hypothetical protein
MKYITNIIERALLVVFASVTILTGVMDAQISDTPLIIPSNPIWTDTGITLQSSHNITVHDAAGSWTFATNSGFYGPDGLFAPQANSSLFITNGQIGQLIGFIGDNPYGVVQNDSRLFAVGSGSISLTGRVGKLWLGMNDDYTNQNGGASDNAGSLSVTVTLQLGCLGISDVNAFPFPVGFGISEAIEWRTDLPAIQSGVLFGNSPSSLGEISRNENNEVFHSIVIGGGLLKPSTTYFFKVFSRNSIGCEEESPLMTFTTRTGRLPRFRISLLSLTHTGSEYVVRVQIESIDYPQAGHAGSVKITASTLGIEPVPLSPDLPLFLTPDPCVPPTPFCIPDLIFEPGQFANVELHFADSAGERGQNTGLSISLTFDVIDTGRVVDFTHRFRVVLP